MLEFEDEEFVVIGIDVWDGGASQVDRFFRRLTGATFPLLLFGSGVGVDYGMTETSFVVVDHEGIVRFRNSTTFFPRRQITERVRSALNDMNTAPVEETEGVRPSRFTLEANYPNPFNAATTILYSLADAASASLQIYDMNGRQVRELSGGTIPVGTHVAKCDGRDEDGEDLASGVYLYRLQVGGQVEARKMMLLR